MVEDGVREEVTLDGLVLEVCRGSREREDYRRDFGDWKMSVGYRVVNCANTTWVLHDGDVVCSVEAGSSSSEEI